MKLDPITLEVIRGRLNVIAEQMQYAMIRSAYSNIVKEAGDVSAALYTLEGEMVAQAAGIPILLGVTVPCVARLLERFPIDKMKAGDVYIMNDPYQGGTHLPDVVAISPVMHEGRPIAVTCMITHHVDVGGKTPGSIPVDATDIFQEGFRIPPSAIVREFSYDGTLLEVLKANTRFPTDFAGDLEAQVSACMLGNEALAKLAGVYGADILQSAMTEIIDRSETLTMDSLKSLPHGRYSFVQHLDHDGVDLDKPVRIEVAVTIDDRGLLFDFEGTDEQAKGPFNATPSTVLAAAFFIIRAITDPTIPTNSGCFRPIRLNLPPGTLVNPNFPSPVNARSMTFCIIIDTIFGAMAQAAPDLIPAASYEYPAISFGGLDPLTQKQFTLSELGTGGLGGRPWSDGIDVFRSKAGNTFNSPIEATEMDTPMRILSCGLRPDSGGAGKFRGGNGYRKIIKILRGNITVSHRGDRHNSQPYGLAGGQDGASSRSVIRKANGEEYVVPGKKIFTLGPGDELHVESAGGGGFGPPSERPDEAIRADIQSGKISLGAAEANYGKREGRLRVG